MPPPLLLLLPLFRLDTGSMLLDRGDRGDLGDATRRPADGLGAAAVAVREDRSGEVPPGIEAEDMPARAVPKPDACEAAAAMASDRRCSKKQQPCISASRIG